MHDIAKLAFLSAASFALAGASVALNAAPAAAFTVHHLYVAVACGANGPAVLRYPLSGSTIGITPDLTYSGFGAPLAIGIDGELYAGGGLGECGGSRSTVTAFAAGKTTPLRTLSLATSAQPLQPTALAIDANDDLYVGYLGAILAHGLDQQPTPLHGTLVYAAHPSGAESALQNIVAGGVVSGLVLDAAENLYVSERPAPGDRAERVSIRVFADPETAPRFIRRIGGKSFAFPLVTSGLAIDGTGELYVVDMRVQPPLNDTSTFSAYPSMANGTIKPDRTIVPPAADLAYGAIGLATTGGHLFATFGPTATANGGASGIYEYATGANGKAAPLQTLAAPTGTIVEAVAVGP